MRPKAEHVLLGRLLVANSHERGEHLPRLTGNRPKVGGCRVGRDGVFVVAKPSAVHEQLLAASIPQGDPNVGVVLTAIVVAPHEKGPEEAIALQVANRRDADLELVLGAGGQRVSCFIDQVFGVLIHYEAGVLG